MRSPTRPGSTASANTPDFRQAFLEHVHRLLQIGYSRLDPAALASAHEPVISGRIVAAIEGFLDEPPMEGWEAYYDVSESPEPGGDRSGNDRLRPDIRVKSSRTSPRLRFVFEAKRLRDKNSLRAYLGDDGLGAFLNGEYAGGALDAGMLAYVQAGTLVDWAQSIADETARHAGALGVVQARSWRHRPFSRGPDHTYVCSHTRRADAGPIDIYHTLLLFH